MPNRGKDQKAVFRQSIPVAIEALDVALGQLATGQMEGGESLRRIANQLQMNSSKFGYTEMAIACETFTQMQDDELVTQGHELVRALHDLLEDRDKPSHQIMIIDSDLDSIQKLDSLLHSRFNCRTIIAQSAADALRKLSDFTPDLILLGLVLPDRDGRSLLVDLKRMDNLEDTQIVVISALDIQMVRSECLLLGADDLLAKPCHENKLFDVVRELLDHASIEAVEETDKEPLPNLQFGVEWLEQHGQVGTVIAFLDVDHFHEVFDNEPFEEAKRILSDVAERIGEKLDDPGLLYGGDVDDFLLIMPGKRIEQVRQHIQGMQQVVSATPFTGANGASYSLTFSAGIAEVNQAGQVEQLLNEGRRALAQAKRKGNGFIHAQGEPDTPPRILLAEDDPMIVKLVQHRLQRAGVEVVAVDNGRAALEKGMSTSFDLIVLDVKMPIYDGFEVTRRLRLESSLKDVPIVLFTALGSEQDVVRGFELGADDYITKPFSPAELLARLLHLIRKRP